MSCIPNVVLGVRSCSAAIWRLHARPCPGCFKFAATRVCPSRAEALRLAAAVQRVVLERCRHGRGPACMCRRVHGAGLAADRLNVDESGLRCGLPSSGRARASLGRSPPTPLERATVVMVPCVPNSESSLRSGSHVQRFGRNQNLRSESAVSLLFWRARRTAATHVYHCFQVNSLHCPRTG